MEHQLWKRIVDWLKRCGKPKRSNETYSDADILKVFFWAVLHDRPVSWACNQRNWPIHERRWAKPSGTRVSRRLRDESIRMLWERMEHELLLPDDRTQLLWLLDGKPLVISGCSKDRQAGYGRAAGGKAKGYKLHAIYGQNGTIAQWRLAPMNVDERVIAARMIHTAPLQGYVLADSNYDSNRLHQMCDDRGNLQLVSPRRYGAQHGHGHRKQTAGRLRSKALLENPWPLFGQTLFAQRSDIERYFGGLSNWGGGLTHLPPWVRTYRRVHRWVRAKLVINRLKRLDKITSYVA